MFADIGIIGLGLIGGSLAKAIRNRIVPKKITACDCDEFSLRLAQREGIIDEYTFSPDEKFAGCDIIFICTPVDTIFPTAEKLSAYAKKGCVITDVGSTKGSIYKSMRTMSEKLYFIGGHPMTGSEKFGYAASKEHLFENAYYISAPAENVPESIVAEFENLLKTIGAIPVTVSPCEHDFIVASISHVPHIIASCLVNNVKRLDGKEHLMRTLAAGGFKDITRIASSNPNMWESICFENKEEILRVLTAYENTLAEFKALIANNNKNEILSLLSEAKAYRDEFSAASKLSSSGRCDIVVDVVDKPGSIAVIAVLLSSNNINIKNIGIVKSREQENGPLLISFSTEQERQRSITLLKSHNYEIQII